MLMMSFMAGEVWSRLMLFVLCFLPLRDGGGCDEFSIFSELDLGTGPWWFCAVLMAGGLEICRDGEGGENGGEEGWAEFAALERGEIWLVKEG
jgi:hypothetical protein